MPKFVYDAASICEMTIAEFESKASESKKNILMVCHCSRIKL